MAQWLGSWLRRFGGRDKSPLPGSPMGEGDAPPAFNPRSILALVIPLGVALLLFVAYTAATVPLPPTLHRGLYLLAILYLGVLIFPMPRRFLLWDLAVLAAATASVGYLLLNWEALAYRAQFEPRTEEYVLGCLAMVVVLEVTRRAIGWALPLVAMASLGYAFFGRLMPEPFTHPGYSLERLLANQYLTQEGLFGSLLGIASTLIAVFVLFGCLMTFVGLGDVLMALAKRITRSAQGGPAKLAVVSSALFGSVSGSSTSNVVSTGNATIPLMKKHGFSPAFAGAVEAVASTGGQLMPPIMGVAAFMVADITGVPYASVMLVGIVPALLYFGGLFGAVHLESRRLGVGGASVPAQTAKGDRYKLLLLLPIGLLVFFLMRGYSPQKAALIASVALLACALPWALRIVTRPAVMEFLRNFIYANVTVGLACATAGIVIGALNISGATLSFSYAMIDLAGDSQLALLVATAVVTLILGCGLPTIAAYAVAASFAAPTLVMAGFGLLHAHMFVFYYACLSSITPPVAVAAFAAAGIADASPMRVAATATKLAVAGFIVPFMYVWDDSFFIGYGSVWSVTMATLSGLAGVLLLAVAVIGYIGRRVTLLERLGYVGAGLLFMKPTLETDLLALAIGGALLLLNAVLTKKAAARAHG